MSDENKKNTMSEEEQLSLNDDRRVKVVSPGALVVKRFFRNRIAVVGLVMLTVMFLFSFVGGAIMPYGQDEQFYTYTYMEKEYVAATRNDELRYSVREGGEFGATSQAQFLLAQMKGETEFSYRDNSYSLKEEGPDFYSIWDSEGKILAIACKDIVHAADNMPELSFNAKYEALKAYMNGESAFTADGIEYTVSEHDILQDGTEVAYISRVVVQSKVSGVNITRDFKERLEETIDNGEEKFLYTNEAGEESEYTIAYDASAKVWSVTQATKTYVYEVYGSPSKEHPLGQKRHGYADPSDVRRPYVADGRLYRRLYRNGDRRNFRRPCRIFWALGGQPDYAYCRRILLYSLYAAADYFGCGDGRYERGPSNPHGLSDVGVGFPGLAGRGPSGARADFISA